MPATCGRDINSVRSAEVQPNSLNDSRGWHGLVLQAVASYTRSNTPGLGLPDMTWNSMPFQDSAISDHQPAARVSVMRISSTSMIARSLPSNVRVPVLLSFSIAMVMLFPLTL